MYQDQKLGVEDYYVVLSTQLEKLNHLAASNTNGRTSGKGDHTRAAPRRLTLLEQVSR